MRGYSKTSIIGNLGKDPHMEYTPEGTAYTKFPVAVNRKAGEDELVDWYNVVAWGKLAENCNEYLSKGCAVFVDGQMKSREFEGKIYWDLSARDVVFLSSKEQQP